MFPLAAARYPDLPERPRVLVPVGATEQHGPHLPLSTDTVIATTVAQQVGGPTSRLVSPAIPFNSSGEYPGFPGVFSVGTRVLTEMIIELTRSLTLWAGEIVFVNGHGGNVGALRTAVETLRAQGHDVRWLPCAVPGDAHAGYTETSIMLHLAPGDVAPTEAVAGNVEPLPELMDRLRRNGVRAVSPNGVLGDPAGASARAGAELVDRMVRRIVDELR